MAIITINTGSGANSGDGDSIRTAFTKINQNFRNLENSFVGAGVASFNGQGGVITFTSTDIVSLLGYIPYSSTNPQNFLSSAVLDTYATQAYVQNSLTNYITTSTALGFVSTSTLQNYATLNYVNNTLTNYLTPGTLPGFLTSYVTATFLFSLGYQDANQVNNLIAAAGAGYITTATLLTYATIAYVDSSIAAVGTSDRITAKDNSGTVVASLTITPSGNIQSSPGRISYQNQNTGLLAFDHASSSTYTKLSGRFYSSPFTATSVDFSLEFDYITGQLFLPEYKASTQRRYMGANDNPQRPGWAAPGGSNLAFQRARIFSTNYEYTADLNNTENLWDWGKAVVLAVDVDRTLGSGVNETFYNYAQVSANGVELYAHSGTVGISVGYPVFRNDTYFVDKLIYEFSAQGITFPDGTIQSTAGGGGGGGVTNANVSLSNLQPTSINTSLLPSTPATYNIGSSSLRWNNIYVHTGTIYTEQLWIDTTQDVYAKIKFLQGPTQPIYGFQDENSSVWVLVNEEATVKQCLFVGDTGSTSDRTVFGVSVHDNIIGVTSGAENNWKTNLDLKGNGNLNLPRGGLITAGSIVPLNTATTATIGISSMPWASLYASTVNTDSLIMPTGAGIDSTDPTYDYIFGGVARSIELTSEQNVRVTANNTGISQTFIFGSAGTLTYPDGTNQTTAYSATGEQRFNIRTTNFNAVVNQRYGVSTTATSVTATLPSSPSLGDAIFFADAGGNFSVNNLTLARNGNTIMGSASNLVVNINGDSLGVFWNGSTWRLYE